MNKMNDFLKGLRELGCIISKPRWNEDLELWCRDIWAPGEATLIVNADQKGPPPTVPSLYARLAKKLIEGSIDFS